MKRILRNSALFFVLLVVVLNLIGLFLPQYYGNPYYNTKYQYFQKNASKYNTAIFGSSRLYRQFDPQQFDNAFTIQRTRTFNFAAPATHHPEFYYLYENLIQEIEKGSLKYVFIELEPLNKIALTNLTSARNNYWLSVSEVNYAHQYVQESNYGLRDQLWFNLSYGFSYVWKILGFQNPKQLLEDHYDYRVLGENGNGFRTLDEELLQANNENWIKRQNQFLKDTTVAKKRIVRIKKELEENDLTSFLNQYHLNKLNELIDLSKEKGIHLTFVIPPKLPEYGELYALKKDLPEAHVIDISDPDKYPLLYQSKFTFDVGHLNAVGAKLFTDYLIEEVKNKKIVATP